MNHNGRYGGNLFAKLGNNLMEVLSLLGAIIAPIFVYIWLRLNPGIPVYLKLGAGIVSLLFTFLYCLIYISSFVRRHLRYFFYGACYLISIFAVYLAYFNNFNEGHSIVLMLVVFYIALTFDKISSLLYYLMTILILVVLAAYLEESYTKIQDKNGIIISVCLMTFSMIVLLNLFIRNEDKRALKESQKDYQRLLDASPDGIVVYEQEGIVYANEAIAKMTNAKNKDDLVGRSVFEFFEPEDYEETVAGLEQILEGNGTGYSEEKINFSNNITVDVEVANIATTYNGKNAIMTILRDIGERKRLEEKINQMALYDSVTGLPNRHFLNLQLKNSLETSMELGQPVALMFIDMDRFKFINDTMGHNFGDKVLLQVSLEIKRCLNEDGFISRYGGDEFIVIVENAWKSKAEEAAQNIIRSFSSPLSLEEHKVDITPSIGISFYPMDCSDAETLVKYADIAMYQAKAEGRNNYKLYIPEMNQAVIKRIQMESGLRKALQNSEFILNYQAQIDLAVGDICGAEALIRWNHPEFGIIPPDEFIPLAEETGLIIPIGEWVLKTACKQSKTWQEAGLSPINIAVNVSYQQLKYKGFIDSIKKALEKSGLEPKYLELEITESILKDIGELKNVFDVLSPMGIKLSVDDFGVGYSSFSMLQHIAINNLKIDMSFIKSIPENPKAAAIVKTIIIMGKYLDCHITAEGIEDKLQADFLKENNCDIGQGYLFSKPLEAKDFEKLLRNWKKI